MIKIKNPQKRVLKIWIVITILSVATSIFGLSDVIDIYDGGGAVFVFGLLLGITGLIVIFMYFGRSRIMDDMISGKDLLAQWEFSEEYWRKFFRDDYELVKKEKFSLLKLVVIISVCVLVFLSILIPDGFIIFAVSIFGMMLILLLTVLISTYKHKKRNNVKTGIVLISKSGAYINGAIHTWVGFGTRFENLEFVLGDPSYFEFKYSAPTNQGRSTYTFRIPVPEIEDDQMKKMMHYFTHL